MLNRMLPCFMLALSIATPAMAHFVFVVPAANGRAAEVVFSETLQPDGEVDIAAIAGAKLVLRDAGGARRPLSMKGGEDRYVVELPGEGSRIVEGVVTFGVRQRGEAPPHLLIYHPRTIIGDAFNPKAAMKDEPGDAAPVQIVPHGRPGRLRLEVLVRGKPAPGVEVNLILPDGKQSKVTTQPDGATPPLEQVGRYGAWARFFEDAAGAHDGRKYQQVRHYATLVVDIPAARASRYPPMPQAAASFGAVACDGWLYLYGGHIAPTHAYSTEAVSGQFHRLRLDDPAKWEELPGGPALQGMNLAARGRIIYRVGGMQPRNKPGEKAENHSVADCARFDPDTRRWEPLPPLPEPRSSHDVVVAGDRLIVVGGWNLRGKAPTRWHDTVLMLDLSAPAPRWTSIEQPFVRRALIAAVHGKRVYVIGGFDDESEPSVRVDVLDPATGRWAAGPDLPVKGRDGFAPAACTIDGNLYVSVASGALLRLDEPAGAWRKVAVTTPRLAHRLAPHGGRILIMGGADKGKNLGLIEAVKAASPAEPRP